MTARHGLEIRAAAGADSAGLAELLVAEGWPIPARALAERLEALRQANAVALLALEWGPPSGLVVLHWYRGLDTERPMARITSLLVGTAERRRGIGRLLVKAAAQWARNAGCDALECAPASAEAELEAFCRATGFAEAGPRFLRPLRKRS